MVELLESVTIEEKCLAFDKKYEDLVEIRENLREWLRASPYIPQEIPDRNLEFFLLNSKLSLERAKEKVDMYYTLRGLIPEILANRDPLQPSIKELRKHVLWNPLPKLTPEKYRVTIMQTREDTDSYNPWNFLKYICLVADIRVAECVSMGDIYIYDLEGLRMSHITKLTPIMLKKLEILGKKAYGVKIVALHFINCPSFMDVVLNLIKSALKKKLIQRIHVHTSLESLYNFVPKSILPVDYGGDEISMEEITNKWADKMAEWRDWFIKEESVMTNEALRPGPTINPDDLFGTYGSFRKLDVD